VPCTQPTQIKIPLSTDTNTNGLVVSCLTINTPADPTVAVIHDLEWLGAPWTTATTGGLPTGWNWDTTFVGGKRAFTLNGMPWPAAGKYCFQLTLPAGASLPTPLKIYASNSLGQIIGYLQ